MSNGSGIVYSRLEKTDVLKCAIRDAATRQLYVIYVIRPFKYSHFLTHVC